MDNAYQHSTIAQIIENILELYTFEGESRSNIADILLSILNKTEYNEDPHSVIGDLLIRLKAKIEGESFDPYDAAYTSRIAEILISILEETEYTEEPQSRIAELLLQLKEELEAYTELTASGSIASFITNVVKPLVNGEFTIQAYQEGSGDPSPDNVRNIVGFSEQNIFNSSITPADKLIPITPNQSGSGDPSPINVRPITAGLTITRDDSSVLEIYGGTLNVVNGELISTLSKFVIDETKNFGLPGGHATGYSCYRLTKGFNGIPSNCKDLSAIICCDMFETEYSTVYSRAKNYITSFSSGVTQWIISISNEYADAEEQTTTENFKSWLEDHNITVIYEMTTPQIIQLSATELQRAKQALGITSYAKQLGETVYGGSYNSITGMMRVEWIKKVIDETSGVTQASNGILYLDDFFDIPADTTSIMCNCYKRGTNRSNVSQVMELNFNYSFCCKTGGAAEKRVMIKDTRFNTIEAYNEWLSTNPINVIVKLAEPFEIQLDPTLIETFDGANNIFCDTGDTSVTYLYKGTPPENTRAMSKSPIVEDIIKEEKLEDLNELQDPDISDKEVK